MDNKVIDMFPAKKQEVKCSFCGTTEAKATSMIASQINSHHICGACIRKAKELMGTVVEK